MAFGGGKGDSSQAAQTPAASGLDIQTSVLGRAVALCYGATRVAGNLIWYGDFQAIPQSSTPPGGGKGGITGGGKGGGSGANGFDYKTGAAIALSEGPISGIGQAFVDKQVMTLAELNLSLFTGTYTQAPWGILTTKFPTQALTYPGIAFVAGDPIDLGNSPELPNANFEVQGILFGTAPNGIDADPSLVIADLLTNPNYGAGFPAARLGSLATYRGYALAVGLWISPGYTDQASVATMVADIAKNTNSEFVFTSGKLTLVPYGDEAVMGNGFSYVPTSAPLYDLGDDDFLENQNATGSTGTNTDPVLVTRKRPADALNDIKLEYLNRANQYNPEVVEAIDQAAVDQFGRLSDGSRTAHIFADGSAARLSVQLQLQREAIRNIFEFTLSQRYILLDPMDIVTITDAALGLDHQWVRITEITENDDGTLSVTAEEYLAGTGHAPVYPAPGSAGYQANYNTPAPDTNPPFIVAAPVALAQSAQGLELWITLSGSESWGGCDVYASSDGSEYKHVTRCVGGSRQGVLTAPLPAGPDPDLSDTLAVDLSISEGELLSGTQADADAFHTLCVVDGEFLSYRTATLTAANRYNLTYLRRGVYGTPISSHMAGAKFARLDGSQIVIPYTADQIGKVLELKFPAFNIWGGGAQTLAELDPIAFTLPAPPVPPNVANFSVANNGEVVAFAWTQVADNAIAGYDIRYAQLGVSQWEQMIPLTEAKKGTEMTNASVAPGTWVFAIRARDVAGQLSPQMATQVLQVVNTNPLLFSAPQGPGWGNLGVLE